MLHSSREEDDFIVQRIRDTIEIDLSLVITNWEFDALIILYDRDYVSNDFHSTHYFPINTSNDNHCTPFYFYGLTSHYPSTCQVVNALPHS